MKIDDIKAAEESALNELRKKVPKVFKALEKGEAKKTIREYKTRKGVNAFELKVVESRKIRIKEKQLEMPAITIVTIDKETGNVKISVSG